MFAKSYLSINDAIKTLEKQGVTIKLSDLQYLARHGVITPLIYVDADFVNSTYPTGVEVEPKRINERHRFTRFNGYVSCKNANVLDSYVGPPALKTSYLGDLFLHDTDLLFEVVDCLQARSDVVSNGKTGYLFEPLRMGSSGRHTSLQRIPIKDVRLSRDDVEAIANTAKKSVDKQKIIDNLERQLAAAHAQLESYKIPKEVGQHISTDDEPTHHKSVGSMQSLIATLIKMAEYDKEDLADPFGALNQTIQGKSENLELSVKKDFIAKWLKKADEVL